MRSRHWLALGPSRTNGLYGLRGPSGLSGLSRLNAPPGTNSANGPSRTNGIDPPCSGLVGAARSNGPNNRLRSDLHSRSRARASNLFGLVGLLALVACGDPAVPPGGTDAGAIACTAGAPCDDRDPCTTDDVCTSGVCAGAAVECAPSQNCRAAACDRATGACREMPVADGQTCDDGDQCTQLDLCVAGTCTGTSAVACRAPTPCELGGACDPATGACTFAPRPEGTACGDACTAEGACRAGRCEGRNLTCPEPEACSMATGCDPVDGCQYARADDGTDCDDGDACTTQDACRAGACRPGAPRVCVPSAPCRVVVECQRELGCVEALADDDTPCNDANACTFDEVCRAGACTPDSTIECGDRVCFVNRGCNTGTGQCDYAPLANGTSCTDANICTDGDQCVAQQCVGAPVIWPGTLCQDGICFTDVAAALGVDFIADGFALSRQAAGGAFLDFDGDLDLDLMIGAEANAPRLYRNDGVAGFVDVTAAAGIAITLGSADSFMGFLVADYDNDGDPDVYLLLHGPNRFFRNDGGVFVDVTQASGLALNGWNTGAAFGDYDGDGDLDLWVGGYVATLNFPNHVPEPDHLFENLGNGTFADVTVAHGLAGQGTALVGQFVDYDDDGLLDLLVCNDFGIYIEPNRLYRNTGASTPAARFVEVSAQVGMDLAIYCMGVASGDWDRDLDLDYYFTNIGRDVFLENRGALGFVDITAQTGTELTYDQCFTGLFRASWATEMVDLDQDGWLDIYVANGYIPAGARIRNAEESINTVFKHLGPSLAFADISRSAGVTSVREGRGAAFGDIDGDGDIDILNVNMFGAPELYQNDSPSPGGWLQVQLVGRASNRDGLGTKLLLQLSTFTALRVAGHADYASSSHGPVHFGLGADTEGDLELRWPSGRTQHFLHVPAGMRISAVEPHVTITQAALQQVTVAEGDPVTVDLVLANASTSPVLATHALSLRLDDGTVLAGPSASLQISAGATVSVAAQVTVPVGFTGGTARGAEAIATAGDAGGGVDQVARPVTLTP